MDQSFSSQTFSMQAFNRNSAMKAATGLDNPFLRASSHKRRKITQSCNKQVKDKTYDSTLNIHSSNQMNLSLASTNARTTA